MYIFILFNNNISYADSYAEAKDLASSVFWPSELIPQNWVTPYKRKVPNCSRKNCSERLYI